VLYNLPPTLQHLDEGKVPGQAVAGVNDFGKPRYNGPSPPPGKPHRYVFHLFALDTPLGLAAGATKAKLLQAMDGHILGRAELTATYQRAPR
jgi:Raf kinase inhibitor-like YbhB/YbcL family protein